MEMETEDDVDDVGGSANSSSFSIPLVITQPEIAKIAFAEKEEIVVL
jgi:hypothetical protein